MREEFYRAQECLNLGTLNELEQFDMGQATLLVLGTATDAPDDVYWIPNCYPDEGRHIHMSEYLIRGEEATILVDLRPSHHSDTIISETNRLTDGTGPDGVLHLHSTLPHTDNVPSFKAEWGETETVAATGRFLEIVGLPSAKWR